MKKFITLAISLCFTSSMAFAQSNNATVSQTGDKLDAAVEQTGSSNIASATQTGSLNAAEAAQVGSSNSAAIIQSGQSNIGGVWQGLEDAAATNAVANVEQTGTSGEVYVVQGRSANGSVDGSKATVSQAGTDNFVYTIQGASGADNGSETIVNQSAETSNGIAYVFQGHGSGNVATGNEATINQISGVGNNAQISQGAEVWSGSGIFAADNDASVKQNGNNNDGKIYQGVAVEWEVRFDGGSALNNHALVDQNGDTNKARVFQGINGMSASNSSAEIFQLSSGNDASITQHGDSNTATITQN